MNIFKLFRKNKATVWIGYDYFKKQKLVINSLDDYIQFLKLVEVFYIANLDTLNLKKYEGKKFIFQNILQNHKDTSVSDQTITLPAIVGSSLNNVAYWKKQATEPNEMSEFFYNKTGMTAYGIILNSAVNTAIYAYQLIINLD
jgi:hypothetical protein